MADDIDDLLNDAETKFCSPNAQKNGRGRPTAGSVSGAKSFTSENQASKSQMSADIDTMIDDIFDDDDKVKSKLGPNKTAPSKKEPTAVAALSRKGSLGPAGRKCFPVFIGGSQCEKGLSSTVNNRACDNLRCTDCDFSVCIFPDYAWLASVDYLFLRNNIPDFDRLKSRLMKKKGSCAYACQCKSRSVQETLNLQKEVDLKWVCGKH